MNISVIPAWILIIFFPKQEITQKLVFSYAWHIVLAVFYTVFIVWGMYENTNGGMNSLEALRISFTNDKILLAAWAHYLIFDLFVACWIVKDAETKQINTRMIIPILALTLFFGPIGFLAYKGYSKLKKGNKAIESV